MTADETFQKIVEAISAAEEYGSWKCPCCEALLGVSYQYYSRANRQMCGLQVYCKACKKLAMSLDGWFQIPAWWKKEYE